MFISLRKNSLNSLNLREQKIKFMLKSVCPKLPMRNKTAIKDFYLNQLGFEELNDYGDYLLLKKDEVEIHFF